MSFSGLVIFFQWEITIQKRKKSYKRGKIYSIHYYTSRQVEYEKLNTISWNVWNLTLKETVRITLGNESSSRNDRHD